MKIYQKQLCFLFIYFQGILVLFIYLYGFFPTEPLSIKKSNRKYYEEYGSGSRVIDKMAFIVIDALRYDFVYPQNGEKYMPYTLSSILNNESCFMAVKAHSPTVTLPRIKAMTSGMISTYLDVVMNFFSSDFKEENIVTSAQSKGYNIVFYGDETWLKLFPLAFTRSEGTNSFFTFDYTEVDNNVTRHLNVELNKGDWDIMILHYLGLDHIGHTEGPTSPLVKPKLEEMDGIVKRFAEYFKKLEEKEKKKTMLIVTGDHGMKDSGSHGGVTYSEVTVPLVSVGTPCKSFPGWSEKQVPLQIDIAPTMCALFGLPIPRFNMGKIIPSFLEKMSMSEIFKYLQLNSEQLSGLKLTSKDDTYSQFKLNKLQKKTHTILMNKTKEKNYTGLTQEYFQFLSDLSQDVVEFNTDFKLFYIVAGTIGLLVTLFTIIWASAKEFPKPKNSIQWFLILGTICHTVTLLSSSFIEEEHQTWYFFWITLCILIILKQSKKKKLVCDEVKWPWFVIAISHRFLRKLNQTGDKWASFPDIKLFLTFGEGRLLLFPFFLLGMSLVFVCSIVEKCTRRQLVVYGVSLLAITFFKVATGSFSDAYLNFYPKSKGLFEIVVFWASTSIFTIEVFQGENSKYLIWLLIASLFLRPHNVILLPLQVFISKQINRTFHKTHDFLWNNLAHIWMGNVFYFYQGNGNSLANVDVTAGFIGVQSYIPLYAAITTTAHTSSSHILAFILSPKSTLVHAVVRLLPLTVYCTALIVQLHHLFIWSVFSPKLLYEAYFTVVLFVLLFINFFN